MTNYAIKRSTQRYLWMGIIFVIFMAVAKTNLARAGTCTPSGTTMSCSGVFVPAELGQTFSTPTIDTLSLDNTTDITANTLVFSLQNNDFSLPTPIAFSMDNPATINSTAPHISDVFIIRQRGRAASSIDIGGSIESDSRMLQHVIQGSDTNSSHTVTIQPGTAIDTFSTALWSRTAGSNVLGGQIVYTIGGEIKTETVRAIHISQNVNQDIPVNVIIEETSTIESSQQSIYVSSLTRMPNLGLISIDISGKVIGGADASANGGVSGVFGPPAAIIIQSEEGGSEIIINDTGEVSSVNDLAILDLDSGRSTSFEAPMQVRNAGLITGQIDTGGGNDSLINQSGSHWILRNFSSSTSPYQTRDFESVSTSHADNIIIESGAVLSLASITDNANANPSVDTSGEYLPVGTQSITEPAIEQGHLLEITQFEHAGTISMADSDTGFGSAVAGDVMVITGGATAGSNGGADYISNGGTLRLDTVLNEGGSASQSDVLVLDNTTLGSAPIELMITNAQLGLGANTDANGNGMWDSGEGILVVEVLGNASPNTFTMQPIQAGDYRYELIQGSDGNWYLTSQFSPQPSSIPILSHWALLAMLTIMMILGFAHPRFVRAKSTS